jgi:DNA-3-methyladenine glycosylase I
MTKGASKSRTEADDKQRCRWPRSALEIHYHDHEWGTPVHEDRRLFECLTLEGAQAGLSWSIILRKRGAYRKAFARFDPRAVARFRNFTVRRLLRDDGIVRHRGKILATVANARAVLAVQREFGSFDAYIWRFRSARAMSLDLRRRGFRFVGPTICQAFMQATGMVNAHTPRCFRHRALSLGRRSAD